MSFADFFAKNSVKQLGSRSGLIWVKTVCKCYQQTIPIGLHARTKLPKEEKHVQTKKSRDYLFAFFSKLVIDNYDG